MRCMVVHEIMLFCVLMEKLAHKHSTPFHLEQGAEQIKNTKQQKWPTMVGTGDSNKRAEKCLYCAFGIAIPFLSLLSSLLARLHSCLYIPLLAHFPSFVLLLCQLEFYLCSSLGESHIIENRVREMYADAGLLLPLSQGNFQELPASHQHLLSVPDDDFLSSFQSLLPSDTPHMGIFAQSPTVMEYDLGGEGDLFKAPEPIMGEAVFADDPVISGMSMISFGEEVMTAGTIKVADMESIQNDHLSDFIYECKNEFLAKSAGGDTIAAEVTDVKVPQVQQQQQGGEDPPVKRTRIVAEGPMQKSVSAECLSSMDWISGCGARLNFLGFQGLDFGAAFGMRRAYSEGDIQTLGSNQSSCGSTSIVHTPYLERQVTMGERREKLFRFWEKKSRRNFGRKIKYACRKALADSQPRVRGRFAKTEDSEVSKP